MGQSLQEKDFETAYYDELYKSQNIKSVGWVDVRSQEFLDIVNNCVGIIFPSASEGQSGSVVQCLHAGLIPVISYQSGIDVGDFGFTLQDSTIQEVKSVIMQLSNMPEKDLQSMSRKSWEYARSYHTREKFTLSYSEFASDLLRPGGPVHENTI